MAQFHLLGFITRFFVSAAFGRLPRSAARVIPVATSACAHALALVLRKAIEGL